jgi:hypothetical protein
MASSSSASSVISIDSETTREMIPEFDPMAAYEACAPLHWDDKSLTNGEDLQFLLDGELENEDDDDDVLMRISLLWIYKPFKLQSQELARDN